MESGCIKDAQITASSQWDRNHAAIQGRLNFKAGGGKQGGWSAGKNNGNQWIQVALGSYTKLTSIATQGRNAHSQWVTAYKLQCSEDGVNFYYNKVPGQSSPKVCKLPCATYWMIFRQTTSHPFGMCRKWTFKWRKICWCSCHFLSKWLGSQGEYWINNILEGAIIYKVMPKMLACKWLCCAD